MNNKEFVFMNGELYHWGVKGMRWGHRKGKQVHPDYARAHSKKKVQEMSDDELRKTNNRLQEESRHKQLTKKTDYGKKAVQAFIAGGATITAVAGAAKVYAKYGNKALGKIGDLVVKGIKTGGKLTS